MKYFNNKINTIYIDAKKRWKIRGIDVCYIIRGTKNCLTIL